MGFIPFVHSPGNSTPVYYFRGIIFFVLKLITFDTAPYQSNNYFLIFILFSIVFFIFFEFLTINCYLTKWRIQGVKQVLKVY